MAKENGMVVIGTAIDADDLTVDLRNVEKKIEESDVDKPLVEKFEKAEKEITKSVENVEEKIEELQGKIDFLSKQKALSNFQQKQLEEFKSELESLTQTVDTTEEAIENTNKVEIFDNIEQSTENLKEVQNEIKETETTLKNFDTETAKGRKIKLMADFWDVEKQLEDLDKQMEDLRNKYKDQKVMAGDVEVYGLDPFSEFATEEEQAQMEKLYNKYVELQQVSGDIIHQAAAVSQEIYKQEDAVDKVVIKQDENLKKIGEVQTKLQEMIGNYREMERQEIFSDSDIDFMKDLRNEIMKTADELGRLQGTAVHIKGITDDIKPTNFVNIRDVVKGIGNETTQVIRKVGKWALAVFGVRQAYMFIRQSVNVLSQYNEQLATDLEYIRYAVATMFERTIQNIIQLVYKLLYYVNYIAQSWFGINLFAGATVDKFNSANKALQGTNKSAKELQKTLAGFDEMNILQKDGSTDVGGGGGGGAIKAPSVDLSAWQNVKIPKWIEWIAKNKDLIIAALAGIAAGLIALKLGAGGLLALGIGAAVYGLILLILDIVKFIQDPCWSNFANILADLAIVIAAVAVAMIAFNATNPVGWIVLAVAAVVALVAVFIKLGDKLLGNKAQILDTKKAQEQLTEAQKKAKEATDNYVDAVDRAEEAEKRLKEAEEKHQISGESLYNAVQNGTLDYKNMNDAQREVYKAYLNNKQAQEDLKEATKEMTKATKEETKASLENELALGKEKGSYDKYKEAVIKAYKEGKISAGEARDYIERAMGDMSEKSKKTFTEDLPNDVKKGLDPNKYQSAWTKFKNSWNNFWSGLATKLNLNVDATYSSSGKKSAKGAIVYPPRLAVGGVVNQPGRGVPIGNAITGESGAEGVIPLTDSQQMELLGEAIGRYITVNLTNINQMNGRTINRELKKLQDESSFARNI